MFATRPRLAGLPARSGGLAVLLVFAVAVAGCGEDGGASAAEGSSPARGAALARAKAIERAVERWADAGTLADAKAAAEQARNLVTGPRVPGAGDADRNGRVKRVRVGLLPGADGSRGLASPLASGCVERDVLGGSWAHPKARWAELEGGIRSWRADNNTFPGFPSHAQRVVGWATLTLNTRRLSEAMEYSGHAMLHADIVTAAIEDPAAGSCPGG